MQPLTPPGFTWGHNPPLHLPFAILLNCFLQTNSRECPPNLSHPPLHPLLHTGEPIAHPPEGWTHSLSAVSHTPPVASASLVYIIPSSSLPGSPLALQWKQHLSQQVFSLSVQERGKHPLCRAETMGSWIKSSWRSCLDHHPFIILALIFIPNFWLWCW